MGEWGDFVILPPMNDPLFIFAVLCANIVLAEFLVRRTFLKHAGTTILVILITAVVANLGLIPTSPADAPIYGGIFSYVAPMAIFVLLLNVNLRQVLKAGRPMLVMFGISAAGTMAGVFLGMLLINGRESLGDLYHAIGGMFTGTYVGGSVNFTAVALHYGVAQEGVIFAGANAADNIIGTIWIVLCLAIPKWLNKKTHSANDAPKEVITGIEDDTESVHPVDFAIVLGATSISVWFSNLLGEATGIPSILIVTTIALVIAQTPFAKKLKGARLIGMYAIYLFLAVIGALADVNALQNIGAFGLAILGLAAVILLVHGTLSFGLGRILGIDPDVTAVASPSRFENQTEMLVAPSTMAKSTG